MDRIAPLLNSICNRCSFLGRKIFQNAHWRALLGHGVKYSEDGPLTAKEVGHKRCAREHSQADGDSDWNHSAFQIKALLQIKEISLKHSQGGDRKKDGEQKDGEGRGQEDGAGTRKEEGEKGQEWIPGQG